MKLSTEKKRQVNGVWLWTQWRMNAYVHLIEQHVCGHCGEVTEISRGLRMELIGPGECKRQMPLAEVQARYKGLYTALGNSDEVFEWPMLPVIQDRMRVRDECCQHCAESLIQSWPSRAYGVDEHYLPRTKDELFGLLAKEKADADGFEYESVDASMLGGGNLRPRKGEELTAEANAKRKKRNKSRRVKPKTVHFNLNSLINSIAIDKD